MLRPVRNRQEKNFVRPEDIIRGLNLRAPCDAQDGRHGHFGREDQDFTGNGQGPQEAFKQSHVIFKSHDSYY
jgi:S-adenosylmethionine synthetase